MTNHIYSVTLAFTPPGPLHTSLLIAPDEASASAMAMQHVLGAATVETPVMAVLAVPIDADVLRRMLRAVEGREPGEAVSLVPGLREVPQGMTAGPLGQRAAEILRQHPEAQYNAARACPHGVPFDAQCTDCMRAQNHVPLDAADASTFTGPAVDHLWAGRARRLREEDAVCVYGEPIGPPMPDNAA
jgi:hypothetical protein